MLTIISVDELERKRAHFDDVLGGAGLHASPFEAQVTADEAKPATRIVLLHVKHAVHADRRTGVKARRQTPLALVPKTVTQAVSAAIGTHNEEAHETVTAAIRDNRASADQLIVYFGGNETIRISIPEHLGVVQAGVPTL